MKMGVDRVKVYCGQFLVFIDEHWKSGVIPSAEGCRIIIMNKIINRLLGENRLKSKSC